MWSRSSSYWCWPTSAGPSPARAAARRVRRSPAAGSSTAASAPAGSTTSAVPTSKAPSTSLKPVTSSTPSPTVAATPVHKVTATEASWSLPNTLSRMVVLPIPGGLEMMGGLLDGDTSSALVRFVSLPSGKATLDARLSVGVHAAAGASYKGHLFVYGGTGNGTVATVSGSTAVDVAVDAGVLPAPRADLVEAQAAGKVALLGGYDGTKPVAECWSTNGPADTVADPACGPVRYPAVAVRATTLRLRRRRPASLRRDSEVRVWWPAPPPRRPPAAAVDKRCAGLLGSTVWLAGTTLGHRLAAPLRRALTSSRTGCCEAALTPGRRSTVSATSRWRERLAAQVGRGDQAELSRGRWGSRAHLRTVTGWRIKSAGSVAMPRQRGKSR